MCVPTTPPNPPSCLCDLLTKCHKRPRITISINAPDEPADQELLNLDLPPGLTLADLKGFVQVEANFPANTQHFFFNGQPLVGDNQTLEQAGVKDGDMLAVMIRRPGQRPQDQVRRTQQAAGRPRGTQRDDEIEMTRLRALGDHNALRQLQEGRPELAAAVNDPNRWREEWINMKRMEEEQRQEHQRQLDLLNADPFNAEAQARIEEMIRQERVIENLQHAYEHNPEGKSSAIFFLCLVFSCSTSVCNLNFPLGLCLARPPPRTLLYCVTAAVCLTWETHPRYVELRGTRPAPVLCELLSQPPIIALSAQGLCHQEAHCLSLAQRSIRA